MFSTIQSYIMAGLGIALVVICGLFYWYFDHSQDKIAILNQNQAKLEGAVAQQKDFIEDLQRQAEKQNKSIIQLNKDQILAEKEKEGLLATLRKHNLEALAKAKPGLVEERINDATRKRFREIENDTSQ